MEAQFIALHVIVCSILMNIGKLFPATCYRSEVPWKTRLALAIGMMPRGEVCAGIIVNAIALGASGASITIAVLCLAINMSCVSGFIFLVKTLSGTAPATLANDSSTRTSNVAYSLPSSPSNKVAPEVVEPLSELSEKPPPPLITVSNPSPVQALAVEETLPDGDATVTDIAEAA